jgi:hypothetical protein
MSTVWVCASSLLAGAKPLRTIEAFFVEQLAQLNWLFGTNWRKSWRRTGSFCSAWTNGNWKTFSGACATAGVATVGSAVHRD